MRYKDYSYPIRFILDLGVITLVFIISLVLTHKFGLQFRKRDILHLAVIMYLWYYYTNRWDYYSDSRLQNFGYDLIYVFRNTFAISIAFAIVGLLVEYGKEDRLALFIFAPMSFVLLLIRRYLFRKLYLKTAQNSKEAVLFVGDTPEAGDLIDIINQRPWMGFAVEEVIATTNKEYLLDELCAKIKQSIISGMVQRVFIIENAVRRSDLDEIVAVCQSHTVHAYIVPSASRYAARRYTLHFFEDYPLISVHSNPLDSFFNQLLKRIFDVVFSVFILSLLIPVFLIVGLIIKITSRGPVFFIQNRWGINNKPFKTYKFRSMVQDSEDVKSGKYQQAKKGDPRITKIGAFIRKTNIDELPQFLNVLLGDMTVVGPRPHPGPLNLESIGVVDRYLMRHLVKPGITGWAQVNGFRGETETSEKMQKRVDFDIWYIENWSFWLDVRIIVLTAWSMLKGQDTAY